MTEHCYYFWNGKFGTGFPGQKIKTSILKRYLLHCKQYVSGHAAGPRGFHAQALEVQISWRISSATMGETLGSFICFVYFLSSEKHTIKSTYVKFRDTISSDLNEGHKNWMQCGILSFSPHPK